MKINIIRLVWRSILLFVSGCRHQETTEFEAREVTRVKRQKYLHFRTRGKSLYEIHGKEYSRESSSKVVKWRI